jgi:hypothetical protein
MLENYMGCCGLPMEFAMLEWGLQGCCGQPAPLS